jgi:membrane protein DedA with SNARE-associated domain
MDDSALKALNHAFGLTYLILWSVVFARQVCLPVPANLFLLTAGALVHRGEVNVGLVMIMGLVGCLVPTRRCSRVNSYALTSEITVG